MEILAIILAYVVGLLVGWLFVADRPVPDDEADIDTIRLGQAKALDDVRWATAAKSLSLPGEGSTGGATVTIEGANDGQGVWLRIGRPFDERHRHRLHLLDPDAADHLGALLIAQAAHARSSK